MSYRNPPRNWPNDVARPVQTYPQFNAGALPDGVVPLFGANLPAPPPIDYAALEARLAAPSGYDVAEAETDAERSAFWRTYMGVQS